MPVEFKKQIATKLMLYHRALYIVFFLFVMIIWFSGSFKGNDAPIYFGGLAIAFFVFDEIMIRRMEKVKPFLFTVKAFVYIMAIAVGCFFYKSTPVVVFACFILGLVIIFEELLYGNIFDEYVTIPKQVILTLIHSAGTVGNLWFNLKDVWRLGNFAVVILSIIFMAVEIIVVLESVKYYDNKYTEQLFLNEDIQENNNKLKLLQDRVEKVNSEINYQKLNLTIANNELEELNKENRSLMKVMKFFASSFDVEKNARVMMQNIMDVKEPDLCCFYISPDVYMNDESFMEFYEKNTYANASTDVMVLRDSLEYIYELVKKQDGVSPLVIIEEGAYHFDLLKQTGLKNVVAFPAYENDKIYGAAVVASASYDFFKNGYSFYEASVLDFTSALISDRLYIQTEDMAKKDGLTHIYNRTYFNDFYVKLLADVEVEGGSLTIAMLDIDHFKHVNDTYGHLAGDEVIKTVAKIYAKYAKKYNGQAVRYGGEEFLLILRNTSVDKAYEILKEIHDEIENTIINYEGVIIRITSSIGIASYPETEGTVYDVLDSADKAMYFSKTHGRGLVVISGREKDALKVRVI